jgi:hypothetical protein
MDMGMGTGYCLGADGMDVGMGTGWTWPWARDGRGHGHGMDVGMSMDTGYTIDHKALSVDHNVNV